MEVADQWRREWAGTAEYGKVTEGGVTRRVARALEVLHASAPGARVRVMRAAYHSTAGPGAPTASFMMHSSRRVISSGSSFLDSPTFMTKPLEISSVPLESSPERFTDTEDYKVTEPDDTSISEPSKWRSSTGTRSQRLPSEESSSADNASIIDLDARMHAASRHSNFIRKYSIDSDNSEIQSFKRNTARASPHLVAPATLSTLKYKSLLNGNNDAWHDRRKSYSFEDTSPLSETVVHKNDTLAMESSTDSGICKSTEIINENNNDTTQHPSHQIHTTYETPEETFKDWLAKNRQSSRSNTNHEVKFQRQERIIEDSNISKIALQSAGKVSITLPMNNKVDDEFQYMKNHINDESERKPKKVEFCKTELHFAAESGMVKIIATDEKPPPSNDFRKRRSAFVPIKGNFEKHITLFGDKTSDFSRADSGESYENVEIVETDESSSSTRSILKNKIPKPKPYLLGENMINDQIGPDGQDAGSKQNEYIIPTAVSLINKQLQPEEKIKNDDGQYASYTHSVGEKSSFASRTTNKGSIYNYTDDDFRPRKTKEKQLHIPRESTDPETNIIKHTLRSLPSSPLLDVRAKTRQLRDSDLTYFGVDNRQSATKTAKNKNNISFIPDYGTDPDDYFQSVRLIKKVSSVCSSEAESDDGPEYKNLPMRSNFAPVPKPRNISNINEFIEDRDKIEPEREPVVRILKPIIERDLEVSTTHVQDTRRSKTRRHEEVTTVTSNSRSISEPPKYRQRQITATTPTRQRRRLDRESQNNKEINAPLTVSDLKKGFENSINSETQNKGIGEPLYINLDKNRIKKKKISNKTVEPINEENKPTTDKVTQNSFTGEKQEPGPDKHRDHSLSKRKHAVKKEVKNSVESNELHQLKSYSSDGSTSKHKQHIANNNSDSTLTDNINKKSVKSSLDDSEYSLRHKEKIRPSSRQRHANTAERNHKDKHSSQTRKSKTESEQIVVSNKDQQKHGTKRRDRSKSKDNLASRSESDKNHSENSIRKEKLKRESDKDNIVKMEKRSMPRRSEYVINYDDKNGTVSSVCKVKNGTCKREVVHPEKVKDIAKESKTKSSTKERERSSARK